MLPGQAPVLHVVVPFLFFYFFLFFISLFFFFFFGRNLWNVSPKRFFTDSSGMYWRERRLKPGLYTDGNTVYEATYRYRDGRNGMHRVSPLRTYLDSPAVDPKQKERILKKLAADAPDVVLEE